MKKADKAFSCVWLFVDLLFSKRTLPLGEISSKRKHCIDGKYSMDNFNTTQLHRFTLLGKLYMHKKTTVEPHSNK